MNRYILIFLLDQHANRNTATGHKEIMVNSSLGNEIWVAFWLGSLEGGENFKISNLSRPLVWMTLKYWNSNCCFRSCFWCSGRSCNIRSRASWFGRKKKMEYKIRIFFIKPEFLLGWRKAIRMGRGERLRHILVAGHLGEGLVELFADGLELFLFVAQLICKSRKVIRFNLIPGSRYGPEFIDVKIEK